MAASAGSRSVQLQEWLGFVTSQSHVLTESPWLLVQQAYNLGGDGAPAQAARHWVDSGRQSRPWLRRLNSAEGRSPGLATLAGHDGSIAFARFTGDGSKVISGSDRTLRLWDGASGRLVGCLELGPNVKIGAVAPRGAIVLAAYDHRWWQNTKVFELDAAADLFAVYQRPEPPAEPFNIRFPAIHLGFGPPEGEDYWQTSDAAFSPDGATLIVGGKWYRSQTKQLRIFGRDPWRELLTLDNLSFDRMTLSPDGHCLALTAPDAIQVLAVPDGSAIATLADLPPRQNAASANARTLFSRDGRRLALILSGHVYKTVGKRLLTESFVQVRSWDTATWAHTDYDVKVEGEFEGLAVADDLNTVALACGRQLRICDLASGRLKAIGREGEQASSLLFSPSGLDLAFCCSNNLRIWHRDDGRVVELGLHGAPHRFSPDGRRLLSATYGELRLWDATVRETAPRVMHAKAVTACAVSPDGRQIASGSADGALMRWSSTGVHAGSHPHGMPVNWVGYSPDGRRILTRSEMHLLMLWDAASGAEVARLGPHCYRVLACAFSPDGTRIASGSGLYGQSELWLFDAHKGSFLKALAGHTSWIVRCEFSADGRRLISAGDEGKLCVWDPAAGELVAELLSTRAHIVPWAVSPDGRHVAAGLDDGTIAMWESTKGARTISLRAHDKGIHAIAFSPDSKLIAASHSGHPPASCLWDAAAGRLLATLPDDDPRERHLADDVRFSPDGRTVLLVRTGGGSDDRLLAWDVAGPRVAAVVPGTHGIRGFSPDGSLVVTGTSLTVIRASGTLQEVARYWTSGERSLAWVPGSLVLAVGDALGELHVIRLENSCPP
jgi:WD40 repeat protein